MEIELGGSTNGGRPSTDPEITRQAVELVARITALAHPPVDELIRKMHEMELSPGQRRIVLQELSHHALREAGR